MAGECGWVDNGRQIRKRQSSSKNPEEKAGYLKENRGPLTRNIRQFHKSSFKFERAFLFLGKWKD